jgi:hypothetical protein
MNFNEYQPLALRTAKLFPTQTEDLVHVALGLASEWHEAMTAWTKRDITGTLEELGDALWYCALGAHSLGFHLSSVNPHLGSYSIQVNEAMANFISYVKRRAIYGKTMSEQQNEQAIGDLHVIVAGLVNMIAQVNFAMGTGSHLTDTLGEVLQANIDKLKLRYPDKYSDDAAEARADKGGLDARVS